MILLLGIPVIIISALLFWAGWRKSAVATFVLPLAFACALALAIYSNQNPEIGESVARVDWLPTSAKDVSFIRSYSFTAYEFTMGLEEFKAYASSKDWPLSKIETERRVPRYLLGLESLGRPVTPSDVYAKIMSGYFYEFRQSNGGGVSAVFDTESNRAYITMNPR
jgi:hypothetical protein